MKYKILNFLNKNKILIIVFFVTFAVVNAIESYLFNTKFLPYAIERNEILEEYQVSNTDEQIFYGLADSDIKYLNNVLLILPDDIMISFKDKGWNIVVMENLPDVVAMNKNYKTLKNYKCMGFVDNTKKVIFLQETTMPALSMFLFHELGHFADEFSNKREFYALYKKYKNIGYTGAYESSKLQYAIITKEEFFATTFKDYFLYPEYLNENAPDVYNYFSNIY